ncbi:MAG: ABC transporter ATP-binding protein [Acidiferrobacterales bacterium]|nr:ABC transporter ATP-binding protein [Acidiferrobacterales bacterium]
MKHSVGSDNALSVHNLCKTYKNGREALKNVSFSVKQGDFYALLGRNGAGKSTTIGITCSLVNKSSGKVHVFGTDIDKDFQSAKSNIGLVPQEINFSQFETPWNIVINHAGYYGVKRSLAQKQAEKYLSVLGLWSYRHTISRKLSGGMKRRLMIARALMHEPRLLILDEPTAGIDFEARLLMWDYMEKINRDGITIILTTHYLEEAERLCRHVGVIELGEIILDIDMKSLFRHLQQETYVLHIQQPINQLPDRINESMRLIDERTIELDIHKGNQINPIFERLAQTGIDVVSIQNKSNRLETLFIELLKTEADALQWEQPRE